MKPEKKKVELNDEEKAVIDILKKESPQELEVVKSESGLEKKMG